MSHVVVPPLRPLQPRDPHEPGRVATPLELLFDLVFVVAIASNAAQLNHAITGQHTMVGVLGYSMTWFAIWWAWMGFTWFASAYDNDDALYRVLAFVIMSGSLMLAAAVPDLFADGQSVLAVAGYAVMRLGLVGLWLRAAHGDKAHSRVALRYAIGITLVQALWIARLWVPESLYLLSFVALVVCELAVPVWAEGRHGSTPWHRHHIAERFALMTIIVLGEVLLSTVLAIQDVDNVGWELTPLIVGGLLVVFSLWWIYFKREHHDLTDGGAVTWVFSYGHVVVYASVAAVGAGLGAAVDAVHRGVDGVAAGWVVAVGISLFCLLVSGIRAVRDGSEALVSAAMVAGGCLAIALAGGAGLVGVQWAVLGYGLMLAAVVAWHVVRTPVLVDQRLGGV